MCGCVSRFCNVWVCVCVGFVICGCLYVWFCNVWGVCGFCNMWVFMFGFCNVWVFAIMVFVICVYECVCGFL